METINKMELLEAQKIQADIAANNVKDRIKYLEARGYRVVLNNTKDNTNRDNDMIKVLEANGYKITKE